jgi:L,D-transpeptidase catalytic domain
MKLVVSAILAAALFHIAAHQHAWAAGEEWTGSVNVATASAYDAPGGTLVDSLNLGTAVAVARWVYGPALTADNYTWADLGGGRFVHSSTLRHSPLPGTPPAPPQIVSTGHWADADLTLQILTLYDGDRPVHLSLMNSGRPGVETETHLGVWPIQRRVADETMRGDGYDISGVLFTQYFTDDAEAIHLNYWLDDNERGIPRSHGCLGLPYADAALAWRFLDIGSVVYVHD